MGSDKQRQDRNAVVPFRSAAMSFVFGWCLLAPTVGIAAFLSSAGGIGGIVVWGVYLVYVGYLLVRLVGCRIRADQSGVLVANVFRTHRLKWDEIAGFAIRPTPIFSNINECIWIDMKDRTSICASITSVDSRRPNLLRRPERRQRRIRTLLADLTALQREQHAGR
jgi:hypothetical protein